MGRGGARPGSGPKKKSITIPVEMLPTSISGVASPSPVTQSPQPPKLPTTQLDEDTLIEKLNDLVLEGNPIALRLALEMNERKAKVALLEAQTRNLKLRNRALSEHLNKKGIELGADEYEPEEDPVQKPEALKVVGQ